MVFRNRLAEDAKTALYRIAQAALTNVERHAAATHVAVDLRGHNRGATLRITDNGRGLAPMSDARKNPSTGLGLRNMQERMDQLGGALVLQAPRKGGTVIEATVPLTHMLPPQNAAPPQKVAAE